MYSTYLYFLPSPYSRLLSKSFIFSGKQSPSRPPDLKFGDLNLKELFERRFFSCYFNFSADFSVSIFAARGSIFDTEVNTFQPNVPFLYPLKRLGFLTFPGGKEIELK